MSTSMATSRIRAVGGGCAWLTTRPQLYCAFSRHSLHSPKSDFLETNRRASVAAPRNSSICWSGKSSKQQNPTEAADGYNYSDPVNKFLGQFLPSSSAARDALGHIDFQAPKLTGLTLQQMRDLVEEGLSKTSWFVTGEVDPRLFAEDFTFKDDSVATSGIKSYAMGVRKLFDQATAKAELIAVEVVAGQTTSEAPKVVVAWRLEGGVNLPFKPKIKPYVVTTTFTLNSEGLIDSQLDEFSVPGWDLLLSTILGPSFGAPAAADVETLRQRYKSKKAASTTTRA